ncbi:tyrosine-type recombinase/integrase [Saccharopolyspora hirsuta]|uniref:Tyrosine-type recombinase/integrase n=1 Tax=Saccharopolyspora hirsuta TaxID=1837 RepID=A0A5M7BIW9_SACHI|nr:tyrosine-type recombinase/integrase [Saccharopolyspora hirsuta]KAA5829549.1 tyrosine-type recombinase/integrase [Saccharopolyspora hirsuta]MBF6511097.1 tyrosine-type recombinase/integrase [Nocardia farcinica]
MTRKRRPEGTRAPNRASSIYFSKTDGYWHGRVTMGIRDDGKPDRRHVQAKTEAEVTEKVRKLERDRDSGNVRKPGRGWKVDEWLTHWVEKIAALSVRYKTLQGYRTAIYHHAIPRIGAHWMERIQPEHFEKLYVGMQESGASAATAHQVHRTLRTAFNEYFRRQRLDGNPFQFVKAPKVEEEEIEPFTREEAQRIITAALKRRNGVRYVIALALGSRQGETLAFKWERLNREDQFYRVRRALQRQAWQHGCDDPHACGARFHRTACAENCKRHRNRKNCVRNEKGHPRPCPPNCTRHASSCPQRHGGGLREVEVKSKAGRRGFVFPDAIFDLLMRHEQVQQHEREVAGTEWEEGGWIFTQPNGRPLDPRRDWAEWKEILAEAGVRDARLHDARHTAATVLLLLGVDPRLVMELMGWSTEAMRKRYMHVTKELRRDVAEQLNGYFWNVNRDGK